MSDNANIDDHVEGLARRTVTELLRAVPHINEMDERNRGDHIFDALNKNDTGAKLKAAIAEDASLGNLRKGWLVKGGSSGVIQEHVLPYILIDRALRGSAIDSILASARAFASAGTSDLDHYALFAGVKLSKAVNMGFGIEIMPWAEVPDSVQKSQFATLAEPAQFLSAGLHRPPVEPTLAVRIRENGRRVLYATNSDAPSLEEWHSEIAAISTILEDVIRCITAVAVWPVVEIGRWSQLENTLANGMGGHSLQHGYAVYDMPSPASPTELDAAKVAELYNHFQRMSEGDKSVLRVALDRLNVGLRERHLVDRAIDIGIALESLLLHGIDDNYRGELKYRMSVRGATFLGGSNAERIAAFDLLKAAYDLRSAAVHTGKLRASKQGKPSSKDVLQQAVDMCARIAREVIRRGNFPNTWESEFVLGGKIADEA